MLEPELRRLAWNEALRRVDASGDGSFFAVMLVQSLTLSPGERGLIADVLEHFGGGEMRKVPIPRRGQASPGSYLKMRIRLADTVAVWRSAAKQFLQTGDLTPLAMILRSDQKIGPLEIELLLALFRELKFKRPRGNQSRMLMSPARFQAYKAEQYAAELRSKNGISWEKARAAAGGVFYGQEREHKVADDARRGAKRPKPSTRASRSKGI